MATPAEAPAFRWRVTGRHPHWVEPAIIDVTASSEHYAISQARGWLYRFGGGLEALQAEYTAACLGWHFREPAALTASAWQRQLNRKALETRARNTDEAHRLSASVRTVAAGLPIGVRRELVTMLTEAVYGAPSTR